MAFELWPPKYFDLRSTSSSSTPTRTDSGLLRPANTNVPTPPRSKRETEMRAMLRGLSMEERAKKLHEMAHARGNLALSALSSPSPKSSSSPLRRRRQQQQSCRLSSTNSFRHYHEGVLGCQHYQTNVAVSAPCCNEFYVCRFCHDAATTTHQVDRHAVDRLQCMRCSHIQDFDPINGNVCKSCNEQFAHYFCAVCRLYDDDVQKKIFHCEQCGVCRVGEEKDFFHCNGCNACLGIEMLGNHNCIQNALVSMCPVCACDMQNTQQPITSFPCGHAMHNSCFDTYRKHSYRCPCCSKSLGDASEYFSRLDRVCQSTAVRAEFNLVACADCEQRSTARAHVMYHKCANCGGYNTNVLGSAT